MSHILVSNENEPLLPCSPSVDLVLTTDLVTHMMEVLEPSLPPIDPSECSFQDVFLPSDEDLLETRSSLNIPWDDASMVLSNDHTIGLDYPTTEPSTNFPFFLISPSIDP